MHHDCLSGSVISIGSGIDARTRSIIDQSVRRDKETVNVGEGGGVGLVGVGGDCVSYLKIGPYLGGRGGFFLNVIGTNLASSIAFPRRTQNASDFFPIDVAVAHLALL